MYEPDYDGDIIVENAELYEDMFKTCMNGSNEEFKKKFLHLSRELNNHA